MAATQITALTVSSITADRTTGTVSDNNTSRDTPLDDYTAFLKGYKVDYSAGEAIVTTAATSALVTGIDANAVTTLVDSTWSFNIPKDGWFKFKYMVAPNWDVATAFVLNDLVFDETAVNVYQCISPITGGSIPSLNATNWVLVPDVIALFSTIGGASDPGNIYYAEFDSIVKPNTDKVFGDATADASLELFSDSARDRDVELYELLALYVDAMEIAVIRYNYIGGEKVARKAEQLL